MLDATTWPAAGKLPSLLRHFERAALLCVGLAVASCGADAAVGADRSPSGGGGSGGSLSSDRGEPVPAALVFTIDDTLTLSPRQEHTLEVVATPPGPYRVQFALHGTGVDGGPGDAALDRSEATTDANGVARVTLTAPRAPAIFSVRASVASTVSAELVVSVSDRGFGTVRVEPIYSGRRSISSWFASVRDGVRCDDLSGTPPPDGALSASAPRDGFPEIGDVPVGPVLAVIVRAGHFAAGCATLQEIAEGQVKTVPVAVSDRPIDLGATELDVSFGLDQPGAEWDAAMKHAVDAALAEFSADEADDAALLLDAMQAEAGSPFAAARETEAWDEALRGLWGADAPTRLRTAVRRWLEQGGRSLVGSDTFMGRLGPDGNDAKLVLSSVKGHAPRDAGFTTELFGAWSADPSDTLLLGISLLWVPSKLLTTLAAAPALTEVPGADGVPDALSRIAVCPDVADTLASLGGSSDEAYANCDADCLFELCTAATDSLWERARDSGATTPLPASLAVTASGAAVVGDRAEAVKVDGTWVGQLQSGPNAATAGGKLKATEPQPPQ
jgi:hypothetical protein